MSPRPNPTWVLHFTHIDHLPTIIEHGLKADSLTSRGQVTREAGNPSIKEKRRLRKVEVEPRGVVADFRAEADSDDLVNWDLMQARYWYDTPEEPDRCERRMTECLVHTAVPFAAFPYVEAHAESQRGSVASVLANVGSRVRVAVRPDRYI